MIRTGVARVCSMSSSISSMSDRQGLPLSEVVSRLDVFAPTKLAESWDNVGLLVEPSPPKNVQVLMLTNDLTQPVMDEAIGKNVDFILSYHPLIFRPVKRLAYSKTWKERIAVTCLENRIAVYSPHTCYDSLDGGVNDWLCEAFDGGHVRPMTRALGDPPPLHVLVTLPPGPTAQMDWVDDLHELCRQLLGVSVEARYQDVVCDVRSLGCSLAPGLQSRLQLCISTPQRHLATVTDFLHDAGVVARVTTAERVPESKRGAGRIVELEYKISLTEAVEAIKRHLALSHVRVAHAIGKPPDSAVWTVAVCPGSGGSLLSGPPADLLLTGEMSHHDVLDAVHAGSHVVLCDHSNTERGFLLQLADRLETLFSEKINVVMSEQDRDPLTVV